MAADPGMVPRSVLDAIGEYGDACHRQREEGHDCNRLAAWEALLDAIRPAFAAPAAEPGAAPAMTDEDFFDAESGATILEGDGYTGAPRAIRKALSAIRAASEATGTFACPRCGLAEPHKHHLPNSIESAVGYTGPSETLADMERDRLWCLCLLPEGAETIHRITTRFQGLRAGAPGRAAPEPTDDYWRPFVEKALEWMREPCTPNDRANARGVLSGLLRAGDATPNKENL